APRVKSLIQIRHEKNSARSLDSVRMRTIIKGTLLPRAGDNPQRSATEWRKSPMKLNDSISTYDVAEALQGETGKFEVTSPNGERYFVPMQPGTSIIILEWAGSEPNLQPFLGRKVAHRVTREVGSKSSAAAWTIRRP